MAKQPHLIFFVADQWRGDVMGHLGNEAAVTPNVDRFAEKHAISFANAYCQHPICGPSRCSFFTGWYPHVRGHRTQTHLLHPEMGEPALPKILRDNGYFVWWAGKNDVIAGQVDWHEVCDVYHRPEPRETIWALDREEEWRGDPGGENFYSFYIGKLDKNEQCRYDKDWADLEGAIRFLDGYTGEKPVCLILTLTYPHPPYGVEDPWFSMIDRKALPRRIMAPEGYRGKPSYMKEVVKNSGLDSWSENQWRDLKAVYYGMCARVDEQFGKLVEALQRNAMFSDSAVFFLADHGDYTGDYGMVEKAQNCFEDCLTRVPLLIKPPAPVQTRPHITGALTELVDIPATAYDLADIDCGYDHFGRSLRPHFTDSEYEQRDAVFCEGGRLPHETQCLNQPYEEPEPDPEALYWPRKEVWCRSGPEATKAVMCRTREWKYVHRLHETDELYDLVNDPEERINVIDHPDKSKMLAELRYRVLNFISRTADVVPYQLDERQFQHDH